MHKMKLALFFFYKTLSCHQYFKYDVKPEEAMIQDILPEEAMIQDILPEGDKPVSINTEGCIFVFNTGNGNVNVNYPEKNPCLEESNRVRKLNNSVEKNEKESQGASVSCSSGDALNSKKRNNDVFFASEDHVSPPINADVVAEANGRQSESEESDVQGVSSKDDLVTKESVNPEDFHALSIVTFKGIREVEEEEFMSKTLEYINNKYSTDYPEEIRDILSAVYQDLRGEMDKICLFMGNVLFDFNGFKKAAVKEIQGSPAEDLRKRPGIIRLCSKASYERFLDPVANKSILENPESASDYTPEMIKNLVKFWNKMTKEVIAESKDENVDFITVLKVLKLQEELESIKKGKICDSLKHRYMAYSGYAKIF